MFGQIAKQSSTRIKCTIEVNHEKELNRLIGSMRTYSNFSGLGEIKIIKKERESDGSWKAIIECCGDKPVIWVREHISKVKKSINGKPKLTTEDEEEDKIRQEAEREAKKEMHKENFKGRNSA